MATENLSLLISSQSRGASEIDGLTKQLERLATVAETSGKRSGKAADDSGKKYRDLGDTIKNALQNPLSAAADGFDALTAKMGTSGSILAGVAGAAAAAGAAMFTLAKSTAGLAEQQANNSLRLGVSIKDYGLLAQASQDAGLAQDALVGTMRGLSKALADNTDEGKGAAKALSQIGIVSKDAFGGVKPMTELLFDIADRLGDIPNPAERAQKAIAILGRGGLEVLPLMTKELRAMVDENRRMGVGFDDNARKALNFDTALDRLSKRLDIMKRKAGEASANFLQSVLPTWFDTPEGIQRRRQDFQDSMATVQGRDLSIANSSILGIARGPLRVTDAQMAAQQALLTSRKEAAAEARRKAWDAGADARKRAAEEAAAFRPINIDPRITGRRFDRDHGFLGMSNTGFSASELEERAAFRPINTNPGLTARRNERDLGFINPAREWQAAAAATQQQLGFQQQLVQLMAGPGGEVAAIKAATALRLEGIELERAAGADRFDVESKRNQALFDQTRQLLELRKRGEDEYVNSVQQGFRALLSGGGSGLKSFGLSQLAGVGSTAVGNLARMSYSGIQGRFQLPGQGTAENPSFLGKLLSGTPLGLDPAAGTNLTAANIQMQAAQMQLAAAGGSGGGGIAGAVGSGLGLLGRFGGGSNVISTAGGAIIDPASIPVLSPNGTIAAAGRPGLSGLTRGLGTASALAAGGFGVYSGIKQGGVSGGLTAAGSAAGAASTIMMLAGATGPLAPIVGLVGLGLGLAPMLFGDKRKKRAEGLDELISNARYSGPSGIDMVVDEAGQGIDYDSRGRMRSSHINLTIQALDARSIIERGPAIAQAVNAAIVQGQAGDFVAGMRQELLPV